MQYRVLVRTPNGSTVWVPMTANSIVECQQLAYSQYERARVLQIVNV